MAKVKAKTSKGPDGNVTIDLGEALERRLARGGMAGGSRPSPGRHSGMGAPFRPGVGFGFGGGPSLGARLGIPQHVRTARVAGGGLLGALGNRILRRVTPGVIGSTSELAVDGVNAVVGIVPFLLAKNDLTVGIAAAGILQLAFDLADAGLDAVGMAPVALEGESRRWAVPQRPANPAAGRLGERVANLHGRLAGGGQRPAPAWGGRPVRLVRQQA